MKHYGKGSIHLKRQKLGVKRRRKVIIVFGQVSLPQTMFGDDGNSTLCVSRWRISVCGRKIAHSAESTKSWPR